MSTLTQNHIVTADSFESLPYSSEESRITIGSSDITSAGDNPIYRSNIVSTTKHTSKNTAPRKRPIRRLNGFFIQKEGDNARVALVNGDKLSHYLFPYKRLSEAQITRENQPFEMDEYECIVDGTPMVGYDFRSAVPPKSGQKVQIDLDSERKKKLELILGQDFNSSS